jgi:plasmid stability protein
MAKKKTASKTRPGRGSDQFIVRLPPGMRDTLADLAAEHGRSMNAEVVDALAKHTEFSRAKDEDRALMLSEVGLSQISKRLMAGVHWLEQMLFEIRDVDLDAFISDQRSQGFNLTRTEAIRKILRTYLDEHGYVHHPKTDGLQIDSANKKNPPA